MARGLNVDLDELGLPAALDPARPKGDQIRDMLEGLAARQSPGDPMPSERSIAIRFGVARMTVRNEVKRLVDDGVLAVRPGSGTVVAQASSDAHAPGVSYSAARWPDGVSPGATVLELDVLQLSERQAKLLNVAKGSAGLRIVRLRTVSDKPVGIERSTLSLERFPGLAEVDLAKASLYATLAQRWQVTGARAESRISAVLPRKDEAEHLQIPLTQPCVLVDLVVKDAEGGVIEAGRSIYRGDLYDISIAHALPASTS